jgi:hypothetical protein
VVPQQAVTAAHIRHLDAAGAAVFVLSFLEPDGFAPARYLVRRLRRLRPDAKIIAGFWILTDEEVRDRDALGETGADRVVTSLAQAVEAATATAPAPVQEAAQ